MTRPKRNHPPELPQRWGWFVRGFQRYSIRYVRKHFHAVRLSATSAPVPEGTEPLLVVLNHPSWWDPLLCFVIAKWMDPTREHFAVMDETALKKYRIFEKLGFFGIDPTSVRGAARFLRTSEVILAESPRTLWVTAQGQFADVRQRPLNLRPGIGHVALRSPHAVIAPLAYEYCFWNERTPEALIRFGPTIRIADHPNRSAEEWTAVIEEAMTSNLDTLNQETMTRDPNRFTTLLGGNVGVGGIYDLWRRTRAIVTRTKFDPAHRLGDPK